MQTIVHAIKIDSDNHGYTATENKPALVMGQATDYAISLIDETGQPFEPQNLEGVNEWRFVLAGDFDQGTPNCLTTSARYAGQGWFHANVSDSWTAEMVHYLGGAAYKPIQAEIIGIGAGGETKSDWVFQFETYIRNRVDAIGHSAPSAITPYMTSADLIAATVDYLDPILEGVESVSGTVLNSTYGNEGILNQLRSTHTTLSNKETDIYNRISNTTTGLPIIQYQAERAANAVNNANYGNAAIKAKVDTLATSAQADATKTELHNFLTAQDGYSVPVLFSNVDNVFDTLDNYGSEIQETVSTISENVDSINGMVDDIDGRTKTLATSAQAEAIRAAIGSTPYGNLADHLAAVNINLEDTAATLATSAQFDTLMRALYSDYSNLESGLTAIIESGTFGLVQLTRKVDALQTAIESIQAALSAMSANG